MDPVQIEAQLRNTFLTVLGGDMSLYEGTKQQYIMRFNNESRNIATGMIAQAQQRNSPINAQDYQSVALDLLNRYKTSMPQQQTYAVPMQQPMYPQPYAMPMQPVVQPMYGQPQPMYRPVTPFNNLRYTQPQQYAPVMQQPMYQPMQPTLAQPIQTGKSLYDGALPSNAQLTVTPMAAPVAPTPPMASVQPVQSAPMTAQQAAPIIQPTVATYSIPQVTKRHQFSDKVSLISGDVVTYQKDNGELINVVNAKTSAMLSDVDATVKALAKKKNAIDVTLKYTPYELVSGNLVDIQNSFIEVKKIIADGRKENKAASEIVGKIVEYCDGKTKGIAKQIENIILDVYNSYVRVANSSSDNNAVIPDTDELECLQTPGTASAEKYISMALSEFEQYSIYDPAAIQVSGWLKEIDIMADMTYAELKKHKAEFSKWAKSHCIIKKPVELYRYSAADHETTNIEESFGYINDTPPEDALEFFTVEAISREAVRVVKMVVQEGKSFVSSTGVLDRSNGTIHIEFE